MRYLKFSILTGIGLFALAMFFLSQSIQGFLNPGTDSAQIDSEAAALDISLEESADFPDLNLDFPAGPNSSDITPPPESTLLSQTTRKPAITAAAQEKNHDHTLHHESRLKQNTPKIKLVTVGNQQTAAPGELNLLVLTQTTREQRTTLIEELLRIDADLVRQIALKPAQQQENISTNEPKTVQQISLTNPSSRQTISAAYTGPQAALQNTAPQNPFLVQKESPIHIVASYRGATIKTIGIPVQNGALHQTIQVVPLLSNTITQATVLNRNLVKLEINSELPLPEHLLKLLEIKLSELGEFQPSEIIKLSGTGLVVGLNGTGDHVYSEDAIKALKSSVATMHINLKEIKTPIQAGNLANVSIIAYVPNQGVTKGQRIECYITAVNQDVDLTGGYLLPTGLINSTSAQTNADAVVMGAVQTDQSQTKSQALIANGAQVLSAISPPLISAQGLPHLKFFLNAPSSNPQTGQLITQKINQFLQSQNSVNSKAMLNSSSMIMISLPNSDPQQAQQLATRLLALPFPAAMTNQAPEVIVDSAKAQIQTSGTVLLEPAKIEHSDFALELSPLATTRLNDLLALMHHLHIPEMKQIEFLRELQQQGKIRAAYREF
ncbi:flagellar basal body P-ring protein FlgI [uncultured Gimesia sp.]|uniref:flagellar basal body P-ring protein FlgI n=1 Tax=uncultured Gimesia sp. TaxID=1678688 RepID=UPI002633B309|nr:flagellar basal body P-ring protein FlgI [uncultured Gimesia sp.]